MRTTLLVVAAVAATAVGLLLVVPASGSGGRDFHYTGRHGQGPCVNVEFPTNSFFGNAFSIADARAIVEQNGGLFYVGRTAGGHTDVVPASSPFASQMHDGAAAVGDPSQTYVDVDSYVLDGGRCKQESQGGTQGAAGAESAPVAEDSVFLCYSQWQTNPGLWPAGQASDLVKQGYWQPVAETSVPTPTKIGDYFLYCNGTNTGLAHLTPSGGWVDASGTFFNLTPDSVLGHYPVAK